jgi:hypothetical protein
MPYYDHAEDLERIRGIISEEIRSGVNSLTASYLVRKYNLPPNETQKVLVDLVTVGDLETHYWVLCSGEHQNFDLDREFNSQNEIPTYSITCSKCGDRYTPQLEHTLISFEPTDNFKDYLQKAS